MVRFEEIGVFLSDTPANDAVLAFAGHMAGFGARHVHCMYVHNGGPGSSEAEPDPAGFETLVREALPQDSALEVTCEVFFQKGSGLVEVLKNARDRQWDLVIVGRRLPSSQMGIGAKFTRIARKSPCSVLVVPEQCWPHIGRVLVAVDCSHHSRLSIETAVALVKAAGEPNPQLVAHTVRQVGSRHDLAGVTFKESAEAQRQYGRRDLERFLADIDTQGLDVERVVTLSEDPAESIAQTAAVRKMDVVVIGSRGLTRPTAALLGSTSERVLMACAMPVLIVKEKGETFRLLEALFATD